ncbi:MAG: DUF3883 domain-containing protein [Gammaproteobacteria bacterium]|nr:DUF3883 domain-containing protein [Gammaproteobacteria bacterium]
MIEDGTLTENSIEYCESLRKAFVARFNDFGSEGDDPKSIDPYFHLRSEDFRHHRLKPGQRESYNQLKAVTSPGQVEQHIAYAYLDDELFELLDNHTVRELLRAALLARTRITSEERRTRLQVKGWDWLECEACVQDYFQMLGRELRSERYNKTAHRRTLMAKLRNRPDGSVEYKHQNISAILVQLGLPCISGYKPRFNYQAQLKKVVLAHLAGHRRELELVSAVREASHVPYVGNWDGVLDADLPEPIPLPEPLERKYLARYISYSQREAENRNLGQSGERFVLEFEKFNLRRAGREDLANEVEWSSKEQGDGLGYDVRSFPIGGDGVAREEEMFIEVKTTNSGKYQPFYISRNEVEFSREFTQQYSLYRVYDFSKRAPRLYRISGQVEDHVRLNPVLYRAGFG